LCRPRRRRNNRRSIKNTRRLAPLHRRERLYVDARSGSCASFRAAHSAGIDFARLLIGRG
jgi:hypothetical protein